ncbi:MAG: hypothetical protein C0524_12955 [Rhodobacter sp.]|nr:hypothetical protein [Rhodobacter sp.]
MGRSILRNWPPPSRRASWNPWNSRLRRVPAGSPCPGAVRAAASRSREAPIRPPRNHPDAGSRLHGEEGHFRVPGYDHRSGQGDTGPACRRSLAGPSVCVAQVYVDRAGHGLRRICPDIWPSVFAAAGRKAHLKGGAIVDWLEFTAAFATFFLSHSVPLRPSFRPRLEQELGRRGFTLAYSALSLTALGWLIAAAGRAPYVTLWDWAPWQRLAPLAVMLPVSLILSLAIARPNPFSFGGARNEMFDPARPGIVRLHRHPLLLALALWATAHVVPNGDLAHVILFGTFAGFAMLGHRLIDRRKRREMGADWDRMRAEVRKSPLIALRFSRDVVVRVAAGLALYLLLIGAHPLLFGVSPLP